MDRVELACKASSDPSVEPTEATGARGPAFHHDGARLGRLGCSSSVSIATTPVVGEREGNAPRAQVREPSGVPRTAGPKSAHRHWLGAGGVEPSIADPWGPQRATPCRIAELSRSPDRVTLAPNRDGRGPGKTPRTSPRAALVLHKCGIVPSDLREERGKWESYMYP